MSLKDTVDGNDKTVLKPLAEATPPGEQLVCYPGGVQCEASFYRGEFSISVKPAAGMRVCGIGTPVIEEITNDRGETISAKWNSSIHCFKLDDPKVEKLRRLKGYFPATVVTQSKRVEIPLRAGAIVKEGDWEIELVDIQKPHISNVMAVFLGMEWKGEGKRAEMTDLGPLLEIRDKQGDIGLFYGFVYEGETDVRTTVTGGASRKFGWAEPDPVFWSLGMRIRRRSGFRWRSKRRRYRLSLRM